MTQAIKVEMDTSQAKKEADEFKKKTAEMRKATDEMRAGILQATDAMFLCSTI
jgi:hypothetical protein